MSCSILNKYMLINNKSIIGKSPYFYELNDDIKCLDIDTPSDFIICELLYKNNITSDSCI
jgi:CMP-N-acetylneuraminic acid synthetase